MHNHIQISTQNVVNFLVFIVFCHTCFQPLETPVKRAVILQKDTWSKMFIGERISLTCVVSNGGGAEWECDWKTTSLETPPKSTEQWVFNTAVSSAGDYWCRGKQKMNLYPPLVWSYPIRLTVLCKLFFSLSY